MDGEALTTFESAIAELDRIDSASAPAPMTPEAAITLIYGPGFNQIVAKLADEMGTVRLPGREVLVDDATNLDPAGLALYGAGRAPSIRL